MFSSVAANGKLLSHCGRPGNALLLQWVLPDIIGALDVEGGLKDAAVGVDGWVSIGKGNCVGHMRVLRQPFAEIKADTFIKEVERMSGDMWFNDNFDW